MYAPHIRTTSGERVFILNGHSCSTGEEGEVNGECDITSFLLIWLCSVLIRPEWSSDLDPGRPKSASETSRNVISTKFRIFRINIAYNLGIEDSVPLRYARGGRRGSGGCNARYGKPIRSRSP